MADEFFKEEEKTEEVEEATPVKLGDKEYSQEDLEKLVGLGEQAVELESKWDTKLDRLMPEYSKSREELKAAREQAEAGVKQQVEDKKEQGQELSQEEQEKLVKEELKKHGAMFQEDFETAYANRRSGEKLLEQTESVVSQAEKDGKPKATTEELLTYMSETGVKDPGVAYEVMFKGPLKEMEMKKLQSIKPEGLTTETSSTAGAKSPAPVSVNKDNLDQLLTEVLTRGGQ